MLFGALCRWLREQRALPRARTPRFMWASVCAPLQHHALFSFHKGIQKMKVFALKSKQSKRNHLHFVISKHEGCRFSTPRSFVFATLFCRPTISNPDALAAQRLGFAVIYATAGWAGGRLALRTTACRAALAPRAWAYHTRHVYGPLAELTALTTRAPRSTTRGQAAPAPWCAAMPRAYLAAHSRR